MDLSLRDHRDRKLFRASSDQIEIRTFQTRRIVCIAAHRCRDNIKSRLLRGPAFRKGRAVCHSKPSRFMDPVHQIPDGNAARSLSACRVHGDDLCPGRQKFIDFLHCRRDVDLTVVIIPLHDSYNRQMTYLRNRVYIRNRLRTYACLSAFHRSHSHPGHDITGMQRLMRQRLTRYNKFSFDLF